MVLAAHADVSELVWAELSNYTPSPFTNDFTSCSFTRYVTAWLVVAAGVLVLVLDREREVGRVGTASGKARTSHFSSLASCVRERPLYGRRSRLSNGSAPPSRSTSDQSFSCGSRPRAVDRPVSDARRSSDLFTFECPGSDYADIHPANLTGRRQAEAELRAARGVR